MRYEAQYLTAVDQLIRRGVEVPEGTVCFNFTEVWDIFEKDATTLDDHNEYDTQCVIPPFDNVAVFVSCASKDKLVKFVVLLKKLWLSQEFESEDGNVQYPAVKGYQWDLWISSNFSDWLWFESNQVQYYTEDGSIEYREIIKSDIPGANNGYETVAPLVNHGMTMLHKKHPVELIHPSRQHRRLAERKFGKKPSPYFLLKVDPNQTQRRLAERNENPSERHMRSHLVRGHFRTTNAHPIEHFNGTRWIPAHARGDKSIGIVEKGYTVVLD